jgi:hypothetical protein
VGGGSSGGSSSGSSGGSSASVQNITGSTGVTDIGGSSSGGSTGGSGSSSGSGSSGGGGSGGSGSSSGGVSSTASSSDGSSSESETGESSEASVQPPGVYGTQYDLQVDVTRPARPGEAGQPASMTFDAAGTMIDAAGELPSDVKSVAYYVSTTALGPESQQAATGSATPSLPAGGLVRRQMPREAAVYSASAGGFDAARYEELLAPEVTALEFRYFDGTEWVTEWDSSTRQALPVCVEIAMTMRALDTTAAADPFTIFAGEAAPTDRVYRLLVHLPGGEPSTADATTSVSDDSTSSSMETSP